MNLVTLKSKLEKGKQLGGEVIYIKDNDEILGIKSIYKDENLNDITLIKCSETTIKVNDLINILDEIHLILGDKEVLVSNNELNRDNSKEVKSVEFVQYDLDKMLVINV